MSPIYESAKTEWVQPKISDHTGWANDEPTVSLKMKNAHSLECETAFEVASVLMLVFSQW